MKIYLQYTVLSLLNWAILLSCTSTSTLKNKELTTSRHEIKLPTLLAEKHQTGVDFWAEGNTPIHWTLGLDFDKNFVFESKNGISFSSGQVAAIKNNTLNASVYSIQNSQGDTKIIIYESNCENDNQQVKVEVSFNNTHYTGCGRFLYNANLDGWWELAQIGSQVANNSAFSKGLPRLKFDITKLQLTGFDGCSNFNTTFSAKGNRVKLESISANSKTCKSATFQQILLQKMSNHLVDYYFKDGKLYLYLLDDTTLIFNRINA